MAEVLIGDDPVGRYIQDKTSLKRADTSIRAMAKELGKKPLEVFELLRQQFESRIGSLKLDEVKKGEMKKPDPGYKFPLKDLYGEISENFFKNLLDLDEGGKPKWEESGLKMNEDPKEWKDEERTFKLNKIDALRDSVKEEKEEKEEFTISKETQEEKGWGRLNKSQMEYLTDVEKEEGGQVDNAKSNIIKHFRTTGRLSTSKARKKMNKGVQNLQAWPITLTTKAQDMVKSDGKVIDTYKPFFSVFQKEKKVKEVLPNLETDATIKIVEDVLGRGLDYGQERREKDEQQVGFDSPLNLEDLPAMACINHQYQLSKGPNYYGDTHFVLDPAVRKRSVYSYGTDCPERRDYYLLLDDILQKDSGKLDLICDGNYTQQDIEVHVYGNIELKKDIIEFHVGDPKTLTSADVLKGSDKIKPIATSTKAMKGTPEEKINVLKDMLTENELKELRKIWEKKLEGSEKLQKLIDSLPPRETDSSCYITTACVTARGLPDDCEELETLRYFRDAYMLNQPGGMDLVKFYYKQAPKIVEVLDQHPESFAIYEELYQVIQDCVKAVQEERNYEAFTTYVTMVLKLRDQYTPNMEVPEPLMEASQTLHKVPAITV